MGWADICSWTSCLIEKPEEDEKHEVVVPVPFGISRPIQHAARQETLEEPSRPATQTRRPPPPPPSVASEPSMRQIRMERDLPPVPAIPQPIYEMGMATPRNGLTRSNSRGSILTTTSTKSRRRRSLAREKYISITGPPKDVRRLENAMPGIDAAGFDDITASRRSSVHQPLTLSIHEADSNIPAMPVISKRPDPRRTKTYDDSPIAVGGEEDCYDDDSEFIRALQRKSGSAPIPLRTMSMLSHTHTIKRKPITPKASRSFSRPMTVSGASDVLGTYIDQLDPIEDAIELDVPAFELSADPKSRTQSYYADAGAALLAETLSEQPPPLPEPLPSLTLDTRMKPRESVIDTPDSRKVPFTPFTTLGSPIEDPTVSPMTPRSGRSRDRLTLFKRSKSAGSSSIPRTSMSLKRRSLEDEPPPLPILPATIYAPSTSLRSSADSITKTGSTNESSRRTSNSSDASETSSQSSQPTRGPSPANSSSIPPATDSEVTISAPVRPNLSRHSTNAPIPIITTSAPLPPLPALPPQAYNFSPPKRPQTKSRSFSSDLTRSLSIGGLRSRLRAGRRAARENQDENERAAKSKSTYYASSPAVWDGVDLKDYPPLPTEILLEPELIPLPPSRAEVDLEEIQRSAAAIPLPADEYDGEFGGEESEDDGQKDILDFSATSSDDEDGDVQEENDKNEAASIHTLTAELPPDHEVSDEIICLVEDRDIAIERWGRGLGAEYGVAY